MHHFARFIRRYEFSNEAMKRLKIAFAPFRPAPNKLLSFRYHNRDGSSEDAEVCRVRQPSDEMIHDVPRYLMSSRAEPGSMRSPRSAKFTGSSFAQNDEAFQILNKSGGGHLDRLPYTSGTKARMFRRSQLARLRLRGDGRMRPSLHEQLTRLCWGPCLRASSR